MAVRTGAEYLAGLRAQPPEIHLGGQRVDDVTAFPGLANGARSLAGLSDMQHDPVLRDAMTYLSPTTGERVGLSSITPKTADDLARRRVMMSHWAHTSFGMMGRTPGQPPALHGEMRRRGQNSAGGPASPARA